MQNYAVIFFSLKMHTMKLLPNPFYSYLLVWYSEYFILSLGEAGKFRHDHYLESII
jgi:hypothetical protein